MPETKPDWNLIKSEYITSGASLRNLSEKYGIPMRTLARHSKKEGWAELRQQIDSEVATTVANVAKETAVDYATRKMQVGDLMLQNIETFIRESGVEGIGLYDKLALTIQRIDGFKGWKSEADLEEQKARIENYRRQIEADNAQAEPTRIIIEGADDYCN